MVLLLSILYFKHNLTTDMWKIFLITYFLTKFTASAKNQGHGDGPKTGTSGVRQRAKSGAWTEGSLSFKFAKLPPSEIEETGPC